MQKVIMQSEASADVTAHTAPCPLGQVPKGGDSEMHQQKPTTARAAPSYVDSYCSCLQRGRCPQSHVATVLTPPATAWTGSHRPRAQHHVAGGSQDTEGPAQEPHPREPRPPGGAVNPAAAAGERPPAQDGCITLTAQSGLLCSHGPGERGPASRSSGQRPGKRLPPALWAPEQPLGLT